jgi:hypothetical protein
LRPSRTPERAAWSWYRATSRWQRRSTARKGPRRAAGAAGAASRSATPSQAAIGSSQVSPGPSDQGQPAATQHWGRFVRNAGAFGNETQPRMGQRRLKGLTDFNRNRAHTGWQQVANEDGWVEPQGVAVPRRLCALHAGSRWPGPCPGPGVSNHRCAAARINSQLVADFDLNWQSPAGTHPLGGYLRNITDYRRKTSVTVDDGGPPPPRTTLATSA